MSEQDNHEEWVTVGIPVTDEVAANGNGNGSPILMSQGEYAIYRTPSGGWHIAYVPSDTDDTGHFEIPAMAVQLLQGMMRGEPLPNPMEMVKGIMAARKNM
jgi:hypothetical protein